MPDSLGTSEKSISEKTPTKLQYLIGLLLLIPVPGLFVYLYNTLLAGQAIGAYLWMAGKVWIVIWPCLWHYWVLGHLPKPSWSKDGLKHGTVLGIIMMCVMLAILMAVDSAMPHDSLKEKAATMKMTNMVNFIGMYAYIAFVNALIEEYVWRWFVTRQWEGLLTQSDAPTRANPKRAPLFQLPILLSGLSFTLHHTVFLSLYVPNWINAICSLGVFTGGVIWSWLLVKYKSVWPAYICHFFADVAIFIYAWHVVF